jgi:hypothetical protein
MFVIVGDQLMFYRQLAIRRLHLQASVKDSEFIYDKDYNAIIFLTTEIHRDMPDTTAF